MKSTLLLIDAVINLVLGVLLLVFPQGLVSALGIPTADNSFYPNILGGVLLGIGIALILEWHKRWEQGSGLGLYGAVAINLCGGVVLAAWLLLGELALPISGFVFLWMLVIVLVGLSSIELTNVSALKRGKRS